MQDFLELRSLRRLSYLLNEPHLFTNAPIYLDSSQYAITLYQSLIIAYFFTSNKDPDFEYASTLF